MGNDVVHRVVSDKEEKAKPDDKGPFNLLLEWPEKNGQPITKQVVGLFSIVTVQLTKQPGSLKLECMLVRPSK